MQMFELQVADVVFGSVGQSVEVLHEIVPPPPPVVQAPFTQLWPLAHALPHAPQLLVELVRLVSQPVLTLWSQSLKPAAQA
jgi:hypothetical protein